MTNVIEKEASELTLPERWARATFGDIGTYINGRAFKPIEWEQTGRPILRIQNLTGSTETINRYPRPLEEKFVVRSGDLLISWSATLGAYVYRGEEAALNQHIFKVVPRIDKMFLYYGTLNYIGELKGKVQGSGMQHITKGDFESTEFWLPPLPEQERIVAKLEELFTRLDAGIENVKRTQALLKRYRQSVLKAAVEGELSREWREAQGDMLGDAETLLESILEERRKKWAESGRRGKYVEPEAPDAEGLPGLSKGWVWSTLPQLGELNRGKSKHRPRNAPELFGGPYPFIQTGDVRKANGTILEYEQTYTESGLAQSRLWPAGTLCITIAANIAETGFLGFDACFPDSVVGFLAASKHVDVRFIEFFLRDARKNIERYAPATAQKNINLEILGRVAIPLPPRAEQSFIVSEVERRLSVIDEMELALAAELRRAESLRQSILHRAFSGQLVPQDPTDEPASALLERIKAEREQMGPAKARRGRPRKNAGQDQLF